MSIFDKAKDAFDDVKDKVTGEADDAADSAGDVADDARDAGRDAARDAGGGASGTFDKTGDAFGDTKDSGGDMLGSGWRRAAKGIPVGDTADSATPAVGSTSRSPRPEHRRGLVDPDGSAGTRAVALLPFQIAGGPPGALLVSAPISCPGSFSGAPAARRARGRLTPPEPPSAAAACMANPTQTRRRTNRGSRAARWPRQSRSEPDGADQPGRCANARIIQRRCFVMSCVLIARLRPNEGRRRTMSEHDRCGRWSAPPNAISTRR